MTIDTTAQRGTALDLVFGPEEGPNETSAHRLLGDDVHQRLTEELEKLPKPLREPAVRDITTAAAGLIDLDLVDMLVAGWKNYEALTAAAKASLDPPGSSERVALDNHKVTWSQRPTVDLVVNGIKVATVDFELSVEFDVSDLIALIRDGRIVEVQTGVCDVTAAFSVEGGTIVKHETHIHLPGAVRLGNGIALLPAADAEPTVVVLPPSP